MTDVEPKETFYREAMGAHQARLVQATRTYEDDPMTARLAVADLLQWSVSYATDVMGLAKLSMKLALEATPDPAELRTSSLVPTGQGTP